MTGPATRIAVILTCHNRRELTLRCLESISKRPVEGVDISIFVTDDGSTDGTTEAVRNAYPDATIIRGDGNLYWAEGMALAERAAVATHPDHYLWLNDDTVIVPGGLEVLLETSSMMPDAIIVGGIADPDTGVPNYGVRRRLDTHPQRLLGVPFRGEVQLGDTFTGNIALIPAAVRDVVGPIDGMFPHAYADDDYGLRASKLGFRIAQAPGCLGYCDSNPTVHPRTFGELRRYLSDPKITPVRAQVRFLRRHGPSWWPIQLVVGQTAKTLRGLRSVVESGIHDSR